MMDGKCVSDARLKGKNHPKEDNYQNSKNNHQNSKNYDKSSKANYQNSIENESIINSKSISVTVIRNYISGL